MVEGGVDKMNKFQTEDLNWGDVMQWMEVAGIEVTLYQCFEVLFRLNKVAMNKRKQKGKISFQS